MDQRVDMSHPRGRITEPLINPSIESVILITESFMRTHLQHSRAENRYIDLRRGKLSHHSTDLCPVVVISHGHGTAKRRDDQVMVNRILVNN